MKNFIFDLQRFVEEYYNDQPNKTLNGTDSADYFENSGGIVKIFAKGGNDTVKNSGNIVTISSGAGDDSINNDGGSNVTIAGDSGNDSIYSYNSVTDGEEDDENAENISVTGGAGNDSVYSQNGEKITLQGGDGNDTLDSMYANNVKIFGGAGKDYLYSYYGENVTLSAGTGDDTIQSTYSDDVSISSGAGNDSIGIEEVACATVLAGAGDDTISIDYYEDYDDEDEDNEKNKNMIVEGGKGNDIITSYYDGTFFKYTYGDGNDTVIGFNSDDTLQIATNKKLSTVSSGGDLYITFDSGSIVLKDVDMGVEGVGKKNIVTIKGGDEPTAKLPTGLTYNKDKTAITASTKTRAFHKFF